MATVVAGAAGSAADGLGRRAAHGAALSYASYFCSRAVSLLTTALLARLLMPSDFGLVAVALVVITLLETLSDFGLNQSLVVAEQDEVEERANTVFLAALALAAALAGLTFAATPALARALDEPRLSSLLPVMALVFVLRALGGTPAALAHKRLDFRTRTVAEMSDVVVRGAVGVLLAVAGAGVWSLVIGSLAGVTIRSGVFWLRVPWRPTWRLRRDHLRPAVSFGSALTGVALLSLVISNVDYLAISMVLGTSALGYYTIGFKLPELAILNLSVVATAVLFPAFSASSRQLLAPRLLRSLHYTAALCAPAAVLLGLLAEPLTLLLFGEKWLPAAPVAQVLTGYALSTALAVPSGSMFKAVGRADLLLALAVPRTLVTVPLVLVVVPHGLVAVGAAQAASALLFAVIGTGMALRHTGGRAAHVRQALTAPLVAAALSAAAVAGATAVSSSPLADVLLGGSSGLLVYAGALLLLAPATCREVYGWMRREAPARTQPGGARS